MIIFTVIVRPSRKQLGDLENAIRETAENYPSLRRQNVRTKTIGERELAIGWVAPAEEKAAPREYTHEDARNTVLFSGLPIDSDARIPAHRASKLAEHWESVAGTLEGFFSAIRISHESASFELRTDVFGFEQVFFGRSGDSWIFSNSVTLVERLSLRRSLDPVAVALFISAGRVGGSRTMLQDIEAVSGATRVSWRRGQRDVEFEKLHDFPVELQQDRRNFNGKDAERLADEMLRPLRALEQHFSVLDSPLTGGRDSRVIFALLTSAKIPARYYTFGQNFGEDAQIARRITETRNIPHEFLETTVDTLMERWEELAEKAVRRADGMYPLQLLAALLTAETYAADNLPVRIWGAGGGIAKGALQPIRFSRAWKTPNGIKAQMCDSLISSLQGLLTPEGREIAEHSVNSRVSEYLNLGISPSNIPDIWYAFQRVGREGGQIMRTTADFRDSFSPFCTRAFLSASFSLPPRLKLTHPVHRQLLSCLAPDLLKIPFDFKASSWKPRQPWKILARGSVRYYNRRLRKRLRIPSNTKANFIVANDMFDRREWFERHLDRMRQTVLDLPNSAIWGAIDRQRFEQLTRHDTDPNRRMRVAKGLYHIWTIAEFEHSR